MTGGGPRPARDYGPGDVARMLADAAAVRAATFDRAEFKAPETETVRLVPTRPFEGLFAKRPWSKPILSEAVRSPVAPVFMPKEPGVRDVREAVTRVTGISAIHLCGPRRALPLVKARLIGFYLSHKLTGRSLSQIARWYGDRDHTTVLSGCRRVASVMSTLGIADSDDVEALITTLWHATWPRTGK